MAINDLGFTMEDIRKSLAPMDISTADTFQDPITEAAFDTTQVQELAKHDLNFLAPLVLPQVFKFAFPRVFLEVWALLLSVIYKSRDFTQLALGLPRGFGKTTLIKLFIVFCILFTQRKFILIISSTSGLAENILADVEDMLNEPNIKNVFGDWRLGVEKDTQSIKKFGYRGRNITLAALGAGTSLRGLNIKNERPDVMIFEDIQTRECADSQVQSEALERWMIGTAMKAKSPAGCLFLFIANMYPTKWSILRRLKTNPSWVKFIVGGILQDGTSLWEELQPITQLLSEFESDLNSGHPEIFYAEVLNDESATVNTNIDISKIPEYKYDPFEVSLGDFIVIDPSNDKSNSDAVAIGHFSIFDGTPILRNVIEERLSPGDTVRRAYEMALRTGCSVIAVESNAYQYSLLYWFKVIGEQLGVVGIECVPVYSGSLSKPTRILNMFKELLASELVVHPDCRAQVHHQISQWQCLRRNNVDGILDCLTYASRVIAEFGHFIAMNSSLGLQEQGTAQVLDMEDNCSC